MALNAVPPEILTQILSKVSCISSLLRNRLVSRRFNVTIEWLCHRRHSLKLSTHLLIRGQFNLHKYDQLKPIPKEKILILPIINHIESNFGQPSQQVDLHLEQAESLGRLFPRVRHLSLTLNGFSCSESTGTALEVLFGHWSETLTTLRMISNFMDIYAPRIPFGAIISRLTALKSLSFSTTSRPKDPHLAASVLSQLEHFHYVRVNFSCSPITREEFEMFSYLGPSCGRLQYDYLMRGREMRLLVSQLKPLVAGNLSELVLASVTTIEVVHLLCDHFTGLRRLELSFFCPTKQCNDRRMGFGRLCLISSQTMLQLAKIVHLKVLILGHAEIDPSLFNDHTCIALKSVESFELVNLHLTNDDATTFQLEPFCQTFARYLPNLNEFVVQTYGSRLKVEEEEIKTNMNLFSKMVKHRFS